MRVRSAVLGVVSAVLLPVAVVSATRVAWSAPVQPPRGHRVEIIAARTETRQVFRNPDGTYTSETSVVPRWVRRGPGWVDVDPTLRVAADGTVAPRATSVSMTFSGGGDSTLAVIADGSRSVTTTWPAVLPHPVLSGNVATYPEVLPGVDLKLTATATGFSEVLVVADARAAANPALRALRFGVHGSGVRVRDDGAGGLRAATPQGVEVFHSGPPLMWDAKGTRRVMAQSVGAGSVTVHPDGRMLSGAQFPLYIDPDWSGSRQHWTYVDKAFPSAAYGLAPSHPYAETGSYGSGVKRSFFQMDTDNVNGKHIIAATFRILENKSYGCGSAYKTQTDLWLTGAISSSTTWNKQPNWATNYANVKSDYGYGSCPNGNVEFNVTPMIVRAAAAGWSNTTVGLRAHDESTVTGWHGFDPGSPRMIITYNTPPATPRAASTLPGTPCVTGANRPYISTTTLPAGSVPSLTSQVYDPDGTQDNRGVQAQFGMHHYNAATGAWDAFGSLLATAFTKSASWLTAQVAMPALTDGQTYSWHVRAYDGIDYSAWTPWCEFTVSNVAPTALPQVSSSAYPAGLGIPHGGVGQPGTFTFTVADPTNVAGYRYSVDDLSAPEQVTATAGTAAVLVTPRHELLNSLHVCPVSASGVVGTACATYDFQVGPPTAPVAQWKFDETAGTTAGGPVPATLSGGTSWTASGRIGRALHLDGSTGAGVTAGPAVDTTKSWSVSAWVRLDSLPADNRTAVAASGSFGSLFYLGFGHDSAGVGRWRIALQSADADPYTWTFLYSDDAHAPRANAWTHLAVEYDQGDNQVRLYVDGALVARAAAPAMWPANGPVRLGSAWWRGTVVDYWNGDLDDVRVYDRVLSDVPFDSAYGDADAEIYQLATRPVRPEGWWALDEVSGAVAADSSGNARPATATGSPLWTDSGAFGGAVSLNGTDQWLATSTPPLRTDGSFSVAAWVRLDSELLGGALPAATVTAVSQDGTVQSPFYLGARSFTETQSDGTSKKVLRWCLAMSVIDGSTPSGTSWQFAKASVPLDVSVLDQWVLLVGVYDAPARMVRLYVPGTGDYAATQLPAYFSGWNATGGLTIGRSKYKSTGYDFWPGQIDQVRAYTGVLSAAEAADLFQDITPAVGQ